MPFRSPRRCLSVRHAPTTIDKKPLTMRRKENEEYDPDWGSKNRTGRIEVSVLPIDAIAGFLRKPGSHDKSLLSSS